MSEIDDFEYTLTRAALREIRAEAWDEGFEEGTMYLPNANPYRD